MLKAEITILLISFVFLIVGLFMRRKGSYLLNNGKIAKAIVFKNNFHPGNGGGSYFPVVRFLTDKQEWITQELSTGYSPAIPEGTKLEVIYDPEDPTYVEINSSLQLKILPILFVALGAGGLVVGLWEYLKIIEFVSN